MLKQGLSIDTTFYPPQFSLDSTFKPLKTIFWNLKDEIPLNFQKNIQQPNTTLICIYWYYFWPTLVFAGQSL
jgi:hypothetical protein